MDPMIQTLIVVVPAMGAAIAAAVTWSDARVNRAIDPLRKQIAEMQQQIEHMESGADDAREHIYQARSLVDIANQAALTCLDRALASLRFQKQS